MDKSDQRWFAYELHDGLLQWVIAARMQTSCLIAKITEADQVDKEKLLQNLCYIKSLLDKASQEGRSLTQFVEQSSNQPVDIVRLVGEYIELVAISPGQGAAPSFNVAAPHPAWPLESSDRAWPVFRILQQAIQNAVQHGKANLVTVRFEWANPLSRTVTVSDNGCGFDPNQEFQNHFGLKSMNQRARQLGAQFAITSSIGKGCTVQLVLPPLDTPIQAS